MAYKLDDANYYEKQKITVDKHVTWHSNGKTERELLKEYREKYGEKRYSRLKEEIKRSKKA